MNQKLKSNSGETLVETLFALLVIVLAMTMLAGAIMSAARVNKGAEDLNTAFQIANAKEVQDVEVIVEHQTGEKSIIDDDRNKDVYIVAYQTDDQNQYCYYTTNSVGDAG